MPTSDTEECFVYIQLPGSQDVVTCGRFVLEPTGVERFVYRRKYLEDARAVLRSDEDAQSRNHWSYPLLADELRRWVLSPDSDLRELFGRMAFNALISNVDDHPRNHALVAGTRGWTLSPAYDLTPHPAPSSDQRDLALVVGSRGRWANRANLLSECGRFRVTREEANSRIDASE